MAVDGKSKAIIVLAQIFETNLLFCFQNSEVSEEL